jgi:hypothetical protein
LSWVCLRPLRHGCGLYLQARAQLPAYFVLTIDK